MLRLALLSIALLAGTAALDAAPAAAQPDTRDHRTQPPPPETRPSSANTVTATRYRRRPGPRYMVPLKVDIGATGANTTNGYQPGVELRAGIHWASLSPRPTNFDLGLGVFVAALPGDDTEMADVDDDVVYGGAYLEIGQTLARGNFWRTWAAGRGEYLGASVFGEDHTGFGVAGRLSAELYISGVGIEPRGLFLGTYAIGVYGEVGARDLGDDVDALQVSAGLTFRTPLVFSP